MIPIVLSGGSGTRLWPVSRASHPKQFNRIFDEALLRKTLERLAPLGPPRVVAVAGSEALTRGVLEELGMDPRRAVYEPRGRNTAPAVALACRLLLDEGRSEEVAGVFPADHLVEDEAAFHRACALAEACAREGEVVTLGIRPAFPSTGYGYIQIAEETFRAGPGDAEPLTAHRTLGFREKPDAATARRYLADGGYLWNAGMFVFRVEVMARSFERLMPGLWKRLQGAEPGSSGLAEAYAAIEPESLDYGIMEHLGEQVSIPCEMGWSDVGSWDEVARLLPGSPAAFEAGGARNNFVFAHRDRVYGLVGVEDLIVVDTADALLVSRRGKTQEVKELVAELAAADRPQATEHVYEVRPWGSFEVLRDEPHFKSKIIRVSPGHQLSYQSHRHRSERWVIVSGRPEVVLDGRVLSLRPGDVATIPQGARHRIRNPTEEPVELVEVQLGTYFGEDDIVRYEDDYDRAPVPG